MHVLVTGCWCSHLSATASRPRWVLGNTIFRKLDHVHWATFYFNQILATISFSHILYLSLCVSSLSLSLSSSSFPLPRSRGFQPLFLPLSFPLDWLIHMYTILLFSSYNTCLIAWFSFLITKKQFSRYSTVNMFENKKGDSYKPEPERAGKRNTNWKRVRRNKEWEITTNGEANGRYQEGRKGKKPQSDIWVAHVKIHIISNNSHLVVAWYNRWAGQEKKSTPHHRLSISECFEKKTQSSRTFSHFLTYLSSNKAKSRITNAKTTLVKNSEARLSFCSAKTLNSMGNAA